MILLHICLKSEIKVYFSQLPSTTQFIQFVGMHPGIAFSVNVAIVH